MHWSVCVSRAEHLQENGFTLYSTEQWKWSVNFKTKLCKILQLNALECACFESRTSTGEWIYHLQYRAMEMVSKFFKQIF